MNKMKETVRKIKNIVKCTKYFWAYSWKHSPVYFFYTILMILVESVGPFVSIIGTKYLVNEIAYENNRDIQKIIFWVVFICLGTLIYKVGDKFLNEKSYNEAQKINRLLATKLSEHTLKMKFADTEEPKILDMIKQAAKALDETAVVIGITRGFVQIVTGILVFTGVIALVISSSPLALIPAIISFVVTTRTTLKGNEIDKGFFEKIAAESRGRDYFEDELSEKRYAQDIRVYDAGDLILDEQLKQGKNIVGLVKKQFSNKIGILMGSRIATSLCQASMYMIIGIDVLLQKVTIGEFSSLIQAALQFSSSLNSISNGYGQIEYTCSLMVKYMEFVEIVEEFEWKNQEELDVISENIEDITIEFRNVSFKYPNTDLYVLKDINTVIHNREHISIVGENGAGKTTFVKLLCRLYDVTEGEILINGKNIQSININDYLKLLSVVFQDFKLLAFSIKDNITLGESVDSGEIMQLCELGGISEWVNGTDKKLDTILYKMFDASGIEPSGGEAQKIAIVRALYKNSPIVILDEPTAALDPISEYEIYQHFDGLVGGKTAIYISHRLSSCKFCDRIIVFGNGTIVEDGTHRELLEREGGIYAKMYDTQAKHYIG